MKRSISTRIKLTVFSLILSISIAGCTTSSNIQQREIKSPVNGRIVFGDTNLTLLNSTLLINDSLIHAKDGSFNTFLTHGTFDFSISTLLGVQTGKLAYAGEKSIRLKYPVFNAWRESLFDQLVINAAQGATVRWPNRSQLNVWVSSYDENRFPWGVSLAKQAFSDWESILSGELQFNFVTDESKAHIKLQFVPQGGVELGSTAIGRCRRTWHIENGLLVQATVFIAEEWHDAAGLYRHEVGHCIGLGHSDEASHLMYEILLDPQRTVTIEEANYARLLYSIPPNTPAFNTLSGYAAPLGTRHAELITEDIDTTLF